MNNNENIRIIKKYQNRKLYDTKDSCYITLDDIATLIRKNEEIQVIDNKTKNDVTPVILSQILVDQEKAAKSTLPMTMLRDLIRQGKGSLFDFIQRYVVMGNTSEPERQREAERYLDQLINRGEITKIEGKAILKELTDETPYNKEFEDQFGKQVSKSLRTTPQLSDLENHIKILSNKLNVLENRFSR